MGSTKSSVSRLPRALWSFHEFAYGDCTRQAYTKLPLLFSLLPDFVSCAVKQGRAEAYRILQIGSVRLRVLCNISRKEGKLCAILLIMLARTSRNT